MDNGWTAKTGFWVILADFAMVLKCGVLGVFCLLSMPVVSATELETIVVTGTRAEQIAGNVTLLQEQDVKQTAAVHPAELFASVPGAWISRGGGQEHLTALRSPVWTGPGACGEVLYAEDGVPVRPSGFCNANQLMEINTEQAGGIEVLRGSQGGALYGANALHGAINVLSLPLQPRRNVRVETGSNDYARGEWEQGNENSYFAINATHDGGYQDSSGYDQQKLSWKYRQSLDDVVLTHYLTASHLDQQSIAYLVGQDAYRDDGEQRNNDKPDAWRDASAVRYVQSWDWEQGDYVVSVKPYLRYSEMDFMQHFNFREPLEENGQRSAGVQASALNARLPWGRWNSGAAVEWADGWVKEWQTLPTAGTAVQGTHYDYDVQMSSAALWQELAWNVTRAVELQVGLRADRIVYQYDNRTDSGKYGRFVRPADRTDAFTLFSPRMGGVVTDAWDNEWYGNVSRGHRAPQTAELYRLLGDQQAADIGDESAQGVEAGWRGTARTDSAWATRWDLTLYRQKKDGVIVRNSSSVYDNSAKTTHEGIELTWYQSFPLDFYWRGAASYAEHRYSSNTFERALNVKGNIIDTAPRTLGSMEWGWTPGASRLALEWVHVGEYGLNPEGQFQYPGHDLFNLRVSHVLDSQWEVFARCMNITNKDYAERADVTAAGVIEPRYFVGLPRTFFVGLTWQY